MKSLLSKRKRNILLILTVVLLLFSILLYLKNMTKRQVLDRLSSAPTVYYCMETPGSKAILDRSSREELLSVLHVPWKRVWVQDDSAPSEYVIVSGPDELSIGFKRYKDEDKIRLYIRGKGCWDINTEGTVESALTKVNELKP